MHRLNISTEPKERTTWAASGGVRAQLLCSALMDEPTIPARSGNLWYSPTIPTPDQTTYAYAHKHKIFQNPTPIDVAVLSTEWFADYTEHPTGSQWRLWRSRITIRWGVEGTTTRSAYPETRQGARVGRRVPLWHPATAPSRSTRKRAHPVHDGERVADAYPGA